MAQQFYNTQATLQRASGLGDKSMFTTTVTNEHGKQVRYFSGVDAEIYFDEYYIDETVDIQFQIQQNAMPLVGYNSYVYDDVAVGSRIIQGSFTINFTKSAYLYEVLQILQGLKKSTTTTVSSDENDAVFSNAEKNNPAMNGSTLTVNKHQPLWGKSFDLVVSYGNAKQANPAQNSSMLILENVTLTSCSQQFNMNGEPIYETYMFMARDVSFPPVLYGSTTTSSTSSTATTESIIVFKSATYHEVLGSDKTTVSGVITMSYKANAALKSLSIEPDSKLSLGEDRGMRSLNISTASEDVATYVVPPSWRSAIKKYFVKGNSKLPINVSAVYTMDDKETTMPAKSIYASFGDMYSEL